MKKAILAVFIVLSAPPLKARADMFGGDGVPRMARV